MIIIIIDELRLINEKHKRKGWLNLFCGCFTNNNDKIPNVAYNEKNNSNNMKNSDENNSIIDSTIDIHPLIFINGFINNNDDKIEYANNVIHKIMNEMV